MATRAVKTVTINTHFKTELDPSAYANMQKQLKALFSNNDIDNKMTQQMLAGIEELRQEYESLLDLKFDPKNLKQVDQVSKRIKTFFEQAEKFSSGLNKEGFKELFSPENISLREIEKVTKEAEEARSKAIQKYREKTQSRYYEGKDMNASATKNIEDADKRILSAQKERLKIEQQITQIQNQKTPKKGTTEHKEQATTLKQLNDRLGEVNLKEKQNVEYKQRQLEILKQYPILMAEMETLDKASAEKIAEIQKKAKISSIQPGNANADLNNLLATVQSSTAEISDLNKSAEEASDSLKETGKASAYLTGELARVTSAAFLIAKAFQGIRAAVRIVKDLDEAMTGIAIVTNQTRDQVWGAYDSFKALADSLSATTQEIADAALLYYQQGLNTAEVMDVVKSTTIAAALAQIQFAEASDRMTAAIRGFDMEMSDSIHVTDTFSSLAAYTAADFNELSYAMTKTASIAHTANMSFENTTAFLAKMINDFINKITVPYISNNILNREYAGSSLELLTTK